LLHRGFALLPRRLAQRRVDAVLPAGAIFLKKIEHVAVDAKRHRFLGAGQRRRLRRQFGRLRRGHRLEDLLGRGARVGGDDDRPRVQRLPVDLDAAGRDPGEVELDNFDRPEELAPARAAAAKLEGQTGGSDYVFVLDVSGSMVYEKDDVPTETTPLAALPTRQDKVLAFLADGKEDFLKRLEAKNPVDVFRMARSLDPDFLHFSKDNRNWTRAEYDAHLKSEHDHPAPPPGDLAAEFMAAWLKPGTDVKAPKVSAYAQSKTLAERAAWDFINRRCKLWTALTLPRLWAL